MPSWFPIKKGPFSEAKIKELQDKEVIIVDGEKYVKVVNPKASEGKDQPKYLYVPVNQYLSKKETFGTPSVQKVEVKKETSTVSTKTPSSLEKEGPRRICIETDLSGLEEKGSDSLF